MLNIYYGRESLDKEKFIYEEIARRGYSASSPVIVLVPDQYTLEAERQAFRILDVDSVIGLDIYSISRLGHNILAKIGQGDIKFINKYGRQMLLTKVISEIKPELEAYRKSAEKPAFIEKMNDFISEMKQYGTTPEELLEIIGKLGQEDALKHKLIDMQKIYSAYDQRIKGKYTDSEDLIDLFCGSISKYEPAGRTSVWVYGFDSFAPKSLAVLRELMRCSKEVNVVLTYDPDGRDREVFELTGRVIRNLEKEALDAGESTITKKAIPELGDYGIKGRDPEIEHLEKALYDPALPGFKEESKAESEGITIVNAANYHSEVETAATYILHLIRDKGYRYRDIVVICNDQEGRGSLIERVFDEYGIPVFVDRKRDIAGSAIAVFLVSLLTSVIRGMRTADVFKTLKTGLSGFTQDEIEKLENYAIKYRIDRGLWRRPFRYGKQEYSEEELAELEGLRARAVSAFDELKDIVDKSGTYNEFLKSFYGFLSGDLGMEKRIRDLADAQDAVGMPDLADETRQVPGLVGVLMDQLNDLLAEEEFKPEEFLELFRIGLRQMEIGVLPSTPDDLMVGTVERTRSGPVRAAVVIGANEGVMPQGGSGDSLFQQDELDRLSGMGYEICKVVPVMREEERLAIYRNFSKPLSELWMSYSSANDTGEAERASEIVEDIRKIFPGKETLEDIISSGDKEALIGAKRSTLRHIAEEYSGSGAKVREPVFEAARKWFRDNDAEAYELLERGLSFDNKEGKVPPEMSDVMLKHGKDGSEYISPSSLETYAGCPFAYFVGSGLSPEERRVFEAGSREIGDVYHAVLMRVTSELSEKGLWDSVSKDEIRSLISKAVKEEGDEYRDGLFGYTGNEEYRIKRMESTLAEAVDILVKHARAGSVKESRYEERFGRHAKLAPVEVDLGDKKVYIEGIIDRMDLLDNDRVKIIDYKSSYKEINERFIKAGYRLQLMLYMKAAESGGKYKPAGVFYFQIGKSELDAKGLRLKLSDFIEDGSTSGGPDEVARAKLGEKEMFNARMEGMVVNDPDVLNGIMGNVGNGESGPIKVKSKGDGEYSCGPSGYLLSEEEFAALQKEADDKVADIVKKIKDGSVEIRPIKVKHGVTACKYCEYKSICRFDLAFKGCRYELI